MTEYLVTYADKEGERVVAIMEETSAQNIEEQIFTARKLMQSNIYPTPGYEFKVEILEAEVEDYFFITDRGYTTELYRKPISRLYSIDKAVSVMIKYANDNTDETHIRIRINGEYSDVIKALNNYHLTVGCYYPQTNEYTVFW